MLAELKRMRRAISTCPHPSKLRFDSERAALERAEGLDMTVYKCVCGKWHMSSCHRDPDDYEWMDDLFYTDEFWKW